MDEYALGKKLLGNEQTKEEKTSIVSSSTASIVTMIAVSSSLNGEVTIAPDPAESDDIWETGEEGVDYIELSEDGDFDEEAYDNVDDTDSFDDEPADMTDGDGANIERIVATADTEPVELNGTAVFSCAVENAWGTELSYQWQRLSDSGEWEDVPEGEAVGTRTEAMSVAASDALSATYRCTVAASDGRNAETQGIVVSIADEAPADEPGEFHPVDDDDPDWSDEPTEQTSDGRTKVETSVSVKEGDRVLVAVQDGKMSVIGVVGGGDEMEAAIEIAQKTADAAYGAAGNMHYIYHDETQGLFVVSKENDPTSGPNLKLTSDAGVEVRDGESVLSLFESMGLRVYANGSDRPMLNLVGFEMDDALYANINSVAPIEIANTSGTVQMGGGRVLVRPDGTLIGFKEYDAVTGDLDLMYENYVFASSSGVSIASTGDYIMANKPFRQDLYSSSAESNSATSLSTAFEVVPCTTLRANLSNFIEPHDRGLRFLKKGYVLMQGSIYCSGLTAEDVVSGAFYRYRNNSGSQYSTARVGATKTSVTLHLPPTVIGIEAGDYVRMAACNLTYSRGSAGGSIATVMTAMYLR